MKDTALRRSRMRINAQRVAILGTNEIASAVAVRLIREGCCVILSHDPFPPVIRRGMAFHDALFDEHAEIEGVVAIRTERTLDIFDALSQPGRVAVSPSPLTELIPLIGFDVIVDARMQKLLVTPDLRNIAPLAIGLGPNFEIGYNCDLAIETHPARAGALVERGATEAADGVARPLGGVGGERFVYASRDGLWRTPLDVGAHVFKDYMLGLLDGSPVRAPRDGVLRGIARDGALIPDGSRLIEIDPRGREACWTGTDEYGRAIADAVALGVRRATMEHLGAAAHATAH